MKEIIFIKFIKIQNKQIFETFKLFQKLKYLYNLCLVEVRKSSDF